MLVEVSEYRILRCFKSYIKSFRDKKHHKSMSLARIAQRTLKKFIVYSAQTIECIFMCVHAHLHILFFKRILKYFYEISGVDTDNFSNISSLKKGF